MTSDACRLVRPGAVAQKSAAKTVTNPYCQVARSDYDVAYDASFSIEQRDSRDRDVFGKTGAV